MTLHQIQGLCVTHAVLQLHDVLCPTNPSKLNAASVATLSSHVGLLTVGL
jgi:hypothetical protein